MCSYPFIFAPELLKFVDMVVETLCIWSFYYSLTFDGCMFIKKI